jgi:hypothetical protein
VPTRVLLRGGQVLSMDPQLGARSAGEPAAAHAN